LLVQQVLHPHFLLRQQVDDDYYLDGCGVHCDGGYQLLLHHLCHHQPHAVRRIGRGDGELEVHLGDQFLYCHYLH
jgi:hypothetical protein